MRSVLLAATLLALAAQPARAEHPEPSTAITGFAGDYAWMNGSNYQPASLLSMGPLTWTLMVDTYYGYALAAPKDHTVFPTTTAPRHHEIGVNLGLVGFEVTEYKHLFGKLMLQHGHYVDTITGPDASVGRGAYAGLSNMRHVQQAYAGHRFDVLNGLNLVMGLFPAYIGLDSYIPQENWNYTHNLLSDFTPYYLMGAMAQLYPRADLKTELWLVNGWQTLAKVNEGFGLGYSVNWRPTERLSLTHNLLAGNFEVDPARTRIYSDNTVQWKYLVAPAGSWYKHHAVAAALDAGWNSAGATLPGTGLGGAALLHRTELNDQWAFTLRGSAFQDPQKLVALVPPGGATLDPGPLTAAEGTATLDFRPSPWILYRLEYRHDQASIPYVAGPGGITAPAGATGFVPDFRTAGDRLTLNATVRF